MPNDNSLPHVYQRTVSADDRHDSLSVISNLIKPGQTVLDLGMGVGGLGQYLSQQFEVLADGVTLNQAEADIASQWYRQTRVADLDSANLSELFDGQRYDCIVCADVLEHLKAPQNLLAQCKNLLEPGGRLLTSVPNAGYCGLVAELIQGEFRYRPEGLLDSTHLRFFTRASLLRFFAENGWAVQATQVTQRSLPTSEFKVAFDSLPPMLARHLLAMPDAQTYQFISVVQPSGSGSTALPAPDQTEAATAPPPQPAEALFSAEVYLARQGRFDESDKLVATGVIGNPRQNLVFDIPASEVAYTSIRLDPADRSGFFKLYHIRITLPDGDVVWQWHAAQDALATLIAQPRQQIMMAPPLVIADNALLLLHGDDPWFELPVAPHQLNQISSQGARLEVSSGWPMSADYLQASAEFTAQEVIRQQSLATMQWQLDDRKLALTQTEAALQQTETTRQQTQDKLQATSLALQAFRDEKVRLISQLRAAQLEGSTLAESLAQLVQHLEGIEQSTMFRATRPLVNLKMKLDLLTGKSKRITAMQKPNNKAQPRAVTQHPVDIVVPVYRGLEDTRRCLESVLAAPCQAAWRLIVINDCSPEPELADWLRELAGRDTRVQLFENPENLGFVGTVNRGMALSAEHDVLLLNSDTEVANNWLDRIVQAAYSAPKVASVTPFSNNATICSYPVFCKPNDLPSGHNTASLDALFASHLAGQTVPVPTGVGFCMYIRRQCLQQVGLFDTENFGKGYGEENDFCVRAQAAGWVNLHALDTFVRHAGGISFGYSKSEREMQAMQTLRRLHPRYEADVMNFVARDPARTARLTLDIVRITAAGHPVILNVIHNREGGTLRHIQEVAEKLGQQAIFLRLTPAPGGVILRLEGEHEAFALHFGMPQEQSGLVNALRLLQVGHIHFHHLLGHEASIVDLPGKLGVSHDFTAHDFFSYCPQISLTDHTDRYCGEQGLDQCRQCLQRHPAPGGVGIEQWRDQHAQLINEARYVIAPSQDTALRLARFAPNANVLVVPHSELDTLVPSYPEPKPARLDRQKCLKIAVLGALSKIKGADVLEEVATLAAQRGLLIDFHLIGYAYRSLRTQPKARLTVHGAYDDKDLMKLLQWLQPDAIWFPAVWPETYSYTLSASLDSGLPIIAPDIGAFAERLQNRPWTWQCDWQQTPGQWTDFFENIRDHHFCSGIGPASASQIPAREWSNGQTFSYRESYLQSLPRPSEPNAQDIKNIQQQLTPNLHWLDVNNTPGNILKSSTLRTIARLRATAAFSPLARLVPTHLQRRVKSWLGK